MSLLDVARDARRQASIRQVDEPLMKKTVDNILDLAPRDLDEYRQGVSAAVPDDPWADHDREALRRADSILKARGEEVA